MGDRASAAGGLMGFIIGISLGIGVVLHKICGASDTMAAVISAAIGILGVSLAYILCMREFRRQDEQ